VIASKTAEDAYPAQKTPGLLQMDITTQSNQISFYSSLDHRPACQCSSITTSDQYPWCLTWLHSITPGHWKVGIVGEIFQIINGLLDSEQFE